MFIPFRFMFFYVFLPFRLHEYIMVGRNSLEEKKNIFLS